MRFLSQAFDRPWPLAKEFEQFETLWTGHGFSDAR
jgi:hypothetical protein